MTQYIGLDNGVSGTIAVIWPGGVSEVWPTPTKLEQNFTKAKKNISRLDHVEFERLLLGLISRMGGDTSQVRVVIEKPFQNPGNFVATATSLRVFEAQLVILERLGVSYTYLDAKEWQKVLLPAGTKGRLEQKKASLDLGTRLFPQHSAFIKKHKDADGLLIAEFCRKTQP